MNKLGTLTLAGLLLALPVGCSDDGLGSNNNNNETPDAGGNNTADANENQGKPEVMISEAITTDTVWTADKIWHLTTDIYISNGTLTVEAGTTVIGDKGASLISTKTGRIVAIGTQAEPIVFTSSQPEGTRKPKDWGGILMMGKATINPTGGDVNYEALPAAPENHYGGTDDAHNCGSIKYARIEFAGDLAGIDKEFNGLTLAGCGSATKIDFVQIHQGFDDGIEMFGGTADLRHIVITQPGDDGLDWDHGWRGRVQFLVFQHHPSDGDNGFEASNLKGNVTAIPTSNPQIWNITMIGSNDPLIPADLGATFKEGTEALISNAIWANFALGPFNVTTDTATNMTSKKLLVQASKFFENGAWETDATDNVNEQTEVMGVSTNATMAAMTLAAPRNYVTPSWKPNAGSEVLTGAIAPPSTVDNFFDQTATYFGAIGAEDWTAGWTAYPEN